MADHSGSPHENSHQSDARSPEKEKEKKAKKSSAHAERRSLKAVPLRWAEQAPAATLKDLTGEEIQQYEVLSELANTEDQYVKDISVVIDIFVRPIREKNLLPEKELSNLFGVIETILPLHQEVLKELRKVQKLSAKEIVIETAEIFVRRNEQFKIYVAHCSAFADIQERIDGLSTRPDFNKFLQECAAKPECRRLLLADFLIMPLQRLLKYPLLLATLKKSTPDKNFGYKLLTEAYEKMGKIADLVNEHMRRISTLKRLQQIKATIEDGDDVELVTPGRELVRELACKIVEKKSRVLDGYLFIFTDMSLVCRVNNGQRLVEKELSYVSENLPPELALKAFDAQESLLELRYSQWGLNTGRKAVSLFVQLNTPAEKTSCMNEINRRARDRVDMEWKAFDMLQNCAQPPSLESLASSSSSTSPGEGRLNITDQNLFAATSYQDMLKEQVRKLQEDLAGEKQTRQAIQDYALVLRYRLQKAAKHNLEHTSTDGTVAKAKYKQLKKRFREVSREKTELEKSVSKLKTRVPGIQLDDTKEKEEKKESTTEKIFGLLSPRFGKKQEDSNSPANKTRPMSMMVSAPTSPVSRERNAAAAAARDPRKPGGGKSEKRPVSMKVAYFEKWGSDSQPQPAPAGTTSAPSVVSTSPVVAARAPAPASSSSSVASSSAPSSSVNASSAPSSASSVSSSSSPTPSASSSPVNSRPVLARIAAVQGRDPSPAHPSSPPSGPSPNSLRRSSIGQAKPTAGTTAGMRTTGAWPPVNPKPLPAPPNRSNAAFRGTTSVTLPPASK